MKWHVRQHDNAQVLRLEGRFDAHGAPAIKAWLADAEQSGPRLIVVNLRQVQFIDSAALAVLVNAHKSSHERGGQLIIAECSQPVRIILELTRLDQVFQIEATEGTALARLELTQAPIKW